MQDVFRWSDLCDLGVDPEKHAPVLRPTTDIHILERAKRHLPCLGTTSARPGERLASPVLRPTFIITLVTMYRGLRRVAVGMSRLFIYYSSALAGS